MWTWLEIEPQEGSPPWLREFIDSSKHYMPSVLTESLHRTNDGAFRVTYDGALHLPPQELMSFKIVRVGLTRLRTRPTNARQGYYTDDNGNEAEVETVILEGHGDGTLKEVQNITVRNNNGSLSEMWHFHEKVCTGRLGRVEAWD